MCGLLSIKFCPRRYSGNQHPYGDKTSKKRIFDEALCKRKLIFELGVSFPLIAKNGDDDNDRRAH